MKTKPPTRPASLQEKIDRALSGGLSPLNTSALLAALLNNNLFQAERESYLENTEDDKGNGRYERNVNVGSIPLEVPRSRQGDFRPSLPPPYQRGYQDAARDLLLRLAASGRSFGAVREALRGLGLPASEAQLDKVARHLIEDFELRNTRPLDTDLLALFVDAKYVDVREGDPLRQRSTPHTLLRW